MTLSFEKLGWQKTGWSGFRFYFDESMDGDCGHDFYYSSCCIALGFWVYEFRIWVKEEPPK